MAGSEGRNMPGVVVAPGTRSTCPYCGVGCGVAVSASPEGISLAGDALHPANAGRLCSKGAALADTLDHEGRLLYPEIRGRRVTWDEALNAVADEFRKTIAEHGADAVAFYVSGQLLTEDYYVANKLMKGFIGSANIDTNSRLCMSSAVVAQKRAFGADAVPVCYEDVEQADLVVIVGSNLAWAHPVLYQRLVAAKKLRPELRVIVIDPRRTATCDVADGHLAIAPGTDAYLFNGLLHYLRREDALNLAYVEAHVEGFAAAFEAVRPLNSIPKVAQICGVPEVQVSEFFRQFAHTERTVTIFSQGINQSSSGVDKGHAIINVHLATGRIGRPGMGPFSVTGQPNAMGGREVGGLANQLAAHMDFSSTSVGLVQHFWGASRVAQTPGLKAVELFQAIADRKIKAVWIMGTNPVVSMPDADRVRAALQQCECVVVSDCVRHTDTTACADILLPALGWGEKDGTVTNSERCISRQRAFMPGAGEARADWWIITQVARRLGFAGAFPYEKPAQIFREHARLSGFRNSADEPIRRPLAGVGDETCASLNEPFIRRAFDISGLAELDDAGYAALQPVQWPVSRTSPHGTARLFGDGQFFTSNGKARMMAVVPRRPARASDGDFPLVLNTGRLRDQWHTMTRTGKVPRLNAHAFEPDVQIHAEDAHRQKLQGGALARLTSDHGSMLARVRISADQRPGSVFVPMHWSDQFARASRVDALVAPVTDPISGQPESKHTPVRVEPYRPLWQGFVLSRSRLNFADASYCASSQGAGYWRYEIAGEQRPESWRTWVQTMVPNTGHWIEYCDAGQGRYRAACVPDGRLEAVFFIAADSHLPERGWLAGLFGQPVLAPADLAGILSARPPQGSASESGRMVCACHGIGEKTILNAIRTQGLDSVEAVGQCLKAGTGCGSCVPEIRRLLQ